MNNSASASQFEVTKSKSRKKLFLLIGLLAIVAVTSVSFYPSMIPD